MTAPKSCATTESGAAKSSKSSVMRLVVVMALCGLAALALAGPARADSEVFLWSGEVTYDTIGGVLPGDEVLLSILFNPWPPIDENPNEDRGLFDLGDDGGLFLIVERGTLDPLSYTCLGGVFGIVNDSPTDGDGVVVSGSTCFDDFFQPVDVGALLTDSTAQALSSGAFLYDIEPSMFDERYIVMETQFGAGLIGSVDQMIETPEPAGGALAALLALAVLARRRHHATASSCRAASDPPRESGGFAGGTS